VDSFDGPQTFFLFSVNIVINGQPPCWSSFVASISAGLSIFRQRRHSQHILLGFLLRRLVVDGQRPLLDFLHLAQRLPCVRHLSLLSNPIAR
jgi:hypothetical protein